MEYILVGFFYTEFWTIVVVFDILKGLSDVTLSPFWTTEQNYFAYTHLQ